jgi:hypothetical protein
MSSLLKDVGTVFKVFKWAMVVLPLCGMLYILYCAVRDPQTVHRMLGEGLMPRIASWCCLIYGSYGLARGRISNMVALLFFMTAMFFAYVGPHVPFFKNYY